MTSTWKCLLDAFLTIVFDLRTSEHVILIITRQDGIRWEPNVKNKNQDDFNINLNRGINYTSAMTTSIKLFPQKTISKILFIYCSSFHGQKFATGASSSLNYLHVVYCKFPPKRIVCLVKKEKKITIPLKIKKIKDVYNSL